MIFAYFPCIVTILFQQEKSTCVIKIESQVSNDDSWLSMLLSRGIADYNLECDEYPGMLVARICRDITINCSFRVFANLSLMDVTIDDVCSEPVNDCDGSTTCFDLKCYECPQVMYRMVEYYQNRHPLMLNLTKLEYLRPEHRRAAIATKCFGFKKEASYKIWLLQSTGLLLRDLIRVICYETLLMFCTEYRILPHYGNILLEA